MNQKSNQSQRYTAEFINKAVQLALSSPQSIAKTAQELGVKESTLYRWVSQHKKSFLEKNPKQGPEIYEELSALRKENARLKEEREILKKAATFFAKESR